MDIDVKSVNHTYTPEHVLQIRKFSRSEYAFTQGYSGLGEQDSIKQVRFQIPLTTVDAIKSQLNNRILEIAKLSDNWDSYGAIQPNRTTINQVKTFLQGLNLRILQFLNKEDIYPTPYGTIVMDFYRGSNHLSLEFGESKVGFFSEFINGQNIDSEGVKFERTVLPNELYKAFTIFLQA
jgi:hypothetical protein